MKLPVFSVIIPAHNEEIYIGETIESILAQTFKNFEIIVVNDNSQDNTKIIAAEYAKRDKRVRVIDVEKGSAAGSRNAGAKIAKGKYLLFQDADCIADKNLLQNALPYLSHASGVATRTAAAEPIPSIIVS